MATKNPVGKRGVYRDSEQGANFIGKRGIFRQPAAAGGATVAPKFAHHRFHNRAG